MSDSESVEIPELKEEEEEQEIDIEQIKEELTENVLKYVKYDDLVKKKQKEIRELNKLKKPCEKFILKYLDLADENIIEITGGKLIKNKSESKAPLSKDLIADATMEKVQNAQLVEEIMKTAEEKRERKVRTNLKRTTTRK